MKDNLIVRLNKLALTHALMALEESAHNLNDSFNKSSDWEYAYNNYHNARHLVHTMLDLDPYNDLVGTVEYHSISSTIDFITVEWKY